MTLRMTKMKMITLTTTPEDHEPNDKKGGEGEENEDDDFCRKKAKWQYLLENSRVPKNNECTSS